MAELQTREYALLEAARSQRPRAQLAARTTAMPHETHGRASLLISRRKR